MESLSLFTIVIPVRDRATLVGRTLDSVYAQTQRPLRVVVVDNGSTDGTAQVLERWKAEHESEDFHVTLVHEPVPGPSTARNCGLYEVDTPYVMFFDSDDVMAPEHCRRVCDALEGHGFPELMYWPLTYVDLNGRKRVPAFSEKDPLVNHIFHTLLSTPRMVVHTGLIRRVGGWNESLTGWEDYELGVRLLLEAGHVASMPETDGVIAYARADSVTGTDFSSTPERWEAALDSCDEALGRHGCERERFYVEVRRMILSGLYRKEGAVGDARRLAGEVMGRSQLLRHRLFFRFVAWYVAHGGRGVAVMARFM